MERLGEVSRAFLALSFSLELIEGTELHSLEPRRQLLQDMRLWDSLPQANPVKKRSGHMQRKSEISGGFFYLTHIPH